MGKIDKRTKPFCFSEWYGIRVCVPQSRYEFSITFETFCEGSGSQEGLLLFVPPITLSVLDAQLFSHVKNNKGGRRFEVDCLQTKEGVSGGSRIVRVCQRSEARKGDARGP